MEVHPKWANLRPKQRALSPELQAELEADIVAAYKRMKSMPKVATYVNRSLGYVHKVLKKHNVPSMPMGRPWPSARGPLDTTPVPRHEKLRLQAIEEILTRPIRTNIKKGK